MITVNNKDEIVGYMIWDVCGYACLEIDIAEVKEEYRNRGILKNMIQALQDKYVDVTVLTGQVLDEAQDVFQRMGWEKINKKQDNNFYLKCLKPISKQHNELQDGLCLAVFSKFDLEDKIGINYFQIKENLDERKLKYFQIDLDEQGRLITPVVTEFDYEGYIGIYLNKQLIKDGQTKRLFNNNVIYNNMLILDKQNFVLKEEWNIK
ncbi:Conserved_hypothetical protein [Hexamita inflata]|uniref:N-acetyltransferase domain-containing protein n=1 Tax=Hexamita inflata TaxID=28002 RepID=A0AA86P575_9EUKA|nr:Conserved hypothetical protein [Hexamita inflata]